MNTIMTRIFAAFFMACLITACGGSDDDDSNAGGNGGAGQAYIGNDSPAEIDNANAKEIGKTSGEAVLQASTASALPTGIEATEQVDLTPIHMSVIETSQDILLSRDLSALPSGIDVSAQVCPDGGSANVDTSSGGNEQTITYNNCTLSGSYTIDGTVVMKYENITDLNGGFSASYQNVTVSGISSEAITINYTLSCTNLSDYQTCTTSSVFTGADGDTHQVSDFEINGSATNGFDGTASFNHYTYGNVSITVDDLTYGSCNGLPDGGSISFSSTTGSSGTINFHDDCSVTGTWNSGSDSGTF